MRVILLVLLLVAAGAGAQVPEPIRDTGYDWRCVDAAGVTISNHQQQHKATVACQRAALASPGAMFFIEAGRYRVQQGETPPEDDTEPLPDPEPEPALVELRWQPPTENVDGSALEDGTAYRIYVGETSGAYTRQIDVPDWAVNNWLVAFEAHEAGVTRWFAVTAFDSEGNESDYSNEVTKTVP